jgi:hypothetical protein
VTTLTLRTLRVFVGLGGIGPKRTQIGRCIVFEMVIMNLFISSFTFSPSFRFWSE